MHLKVNVYELPYDTIPAQMYGGRQPSGCVGRDGAHLVRQQQGRGSRSAPTTSPMWRRRKRCSLESRPMAASCRLSSPLVFPASLSRLEITFAPLLLRSQEDVRFRYRLEEF